MKRTITLFTCMAVCCAMMVSCKNAKTAEPTPEDVQAQKVALADSVLAQIDLLESQYVDAYSKSFRIQTVTLTDVEKMVKPDYFLDFSVAGTLVTRMQKINAMVIYSVEMSLRKIYDMPCDEVKEVIAKLAAEVNFPIDINRIGGETPIREILKQDYEKCKENGDLAAFWQFQYATLWEIGYILANNPELFYSKITEEQWFAYSSRMDAVFNAVAMLAKYDEEMESLLNFMNKFRVTTSDEDMELISQSSEYAKQYFIANKEKYIAKRNALLQ